MPGTPTSDSTLTDCLQARRSSRTFDPSQWMSRQDLLSLAGSVQRQRDLGGRPTPSAGSVYPLRLFAVVERVEGLAPGVYNLPPEGGLAPREAADLNLASVLVGGFSDPVVHELLRLDESVHPVLLIPVGLQAS